MTGSRNARSRSGEIRWKSERLPGRSSRPGSNDPLLDILQTCLKKAHPELFIFSANTGAGEGFWRWRRSDDIVWSHLLDRESGEYNIPYLAKWFRVSKRWLSIFLPRWVFSSGAIRLGLPVLIPLLFRSFFIDLF